MTLNDTAYMAEVFRMVAAIYFLISYPSAKFVEWIELPLDITRRPLALGIRT